MTHCQGVHLCELGNQRITKGALTVLTEWGYSPDLHDLLSILQGLSTTPSPTIAPGKKIFERLGFIHTSLDINGRDGAVEVDLSRPLNTSLRVLGMCDVVTNFGTTEHVGESDYVEADVDLLDIWSSQYEAFRNLHRLARRDGLIINMVPAAGCWPRHGAVEYEPRFFEALANATGYEIMNLSLHRPSYYWTTDETSFFWDLLQKLLARESLQLPASVDPEDMFIMPHMNKAQQGNILSVFRPSSAFIDKSTFLRLPGLHQKSKEPRVQNCLTRASG
ncbi:unnamed protein product [Effrenium voratum]|nr:unnamed protein product [Effrenium voratum]